MTGNMRLELIQVPVSDIDRAKAFYVEKVGLPFVDQIQLVDAIDRLWLLGVPTTSLRCGRPLLPNSVRTFGTSSRDRVRATSGWPNHDGDGRHARYLPFDSLLPQRASSAG